MALYNQYGTGIQYPQYQQQNGYMTPYNAVYPYQQGQQTQIQNVPQQQPQIQMLKGRPVSSFDEAKASMIDLDGSIYVFTDIANKCIYTKQIMLDGTAELKTYKLVGENSSEQKQETKQEPIEYVRKEDFDREMKRINEKVNSIIVEVNKDGKSAKHDVANV